MKKTKLLRPLVEKMENKAMKKRDQIEKYEFWGLVLFVGIPLPGTGAWIKRTGGIADRYGYQRKLSRRFCLESVLQP